eukprot:gene8432-10011_t
MPAVPHTIECGQCDLRRPYTARHCDYCKLCVDNLDHHCPWSGKCIAEKNLRAFYAFTSLLCFQIYYLIAVVIYYIITLATEAPVAPSF